MSDPSRQPVVRPDNYSSIPSIISWLTCVATLLCVIAKIGTKLSTTRTFAVDDVTILLSLLCSVGMVVSISLAAVNGLGKVESALSEGQLIRFQQSMYATYILYIATLFFSKGSLLFILRALTPVKEHRHSILLVAVVLVVWTLSSLFAAAFQCSAPQTWLILSDTCFDQPAFWTYYGSMNIVTELCLLLIPAIVLKSVQMTLRRKALIAVMFMLRGLMIVPIVMEIIYQQQVSSHADNQTFFLWRVAVCMLFIQCASIIFACVPFMRPFFATLEAGMQLINDTPLPPPMRATFGAAPPEEPTVKSYRTMRCSGNGWTEIGAGGEMVSAERQSQVLHPQIILTTTTFEVRSEVSQPDPDEWSLGQYFERSYSQSRWSRSRSQSRSQSRSIVEETRSLR